MPGMLMSDTTMSKSRFSARKASASTPSREAEGDRPVLDLATEFLRDEVFQIWLVVNDEDVRRHEAPVASSSRRPISPRNSGKSMGLVKSPAAPASMALRRVSASP
jgi:hypothetical protein